MVGVCKLSGKWTVLKVSPHFVLHGLRSWPSSAAVTLGGLAFEELTSFWPSGIGSSTSLWYCGCSGPLPPLPAFPAPLPSQSDLRVSGSLLRKRYLDGPRRPRSIPSHGGPTASSVLPGFGESCHQMEEKAQHGGPGSQWGGPGLLWRWVGPSSAFPPSTWAFPGQCPWWSWSLLPSPKWMPVPSCSRVVLSTRGRNGGPWSSASYAIRIQHLESWKVSTWERVPEKTNFRSQLIWEKAHVHGGSFRDLGRGLGGLGPCL